MTLGEREQIDATDHPRWAEKPPFGLDGAERGVSGVDLSSEERGQLLDFVAWSPMLEMYARTMKVAVALTDPEGNLLGPCYNAQPIWTLVHSATGGTGTRCPFCLTRRLPCTAVADALRTELPAIARDQVGLAHVAVPLTLGPHSLGAVIAGQVLDQYPDSLLLERAAREFGVSVQLLWHLSSQQRPMSRMALQMAGDLLHTLGQAFVRQRYGAILETRVVQTNLRFRLLVEGVTDYALFTTDHRGRVTSWNVGAERMLGYPEATIIGQHFSRMFTVEDIRNGVPEKQLQKALQEERAENEGWRVCENQTRLWANVIITPLLPEANSPPGFAIVMQNVTDRRKVAIELENARQERINLQEQFLSHVSHELRTPLTALYFFVTNLLEGVVGDLTLVQREHLEFSLENIKQLKNMVSDLLDVSRIESLKLSVDPRQTFMPRLVNEALTTCRGNAAAKNISLCSDVAAFIPSVWADTTRSRQVLINLIDNAIKFSPDGGTVTVQGRFFEEDPRFLRLSVSDTGDGITPENCNMVFDRLAQVKTVTEASRKGLGLGLFISKQLVARQGGRIWVNSQVGHGSIFSFTLPVFSLAKLCEPIFTPVNLAAGRVTLLSIDAPAIGGEMQAEYLAGIRAIVERSIRAGRDLLLPPMADTETTETFFILVCAETGSAELITRRLHTAFDDFDHGSRLKATISATTVEFLSDDRPWAEQIAEVATRIDKLVQAHLLERGHLR